MAGWGDSPQVVFNSVMPSLKTYEFAALISFNNFLF
jgi:hypothetical protein